MSKAKFLVIFLSVMIIFALSLFAANSVIAQQGPNQAQNGGQSDQAANQNQDDEDEIDDEEENEVEDEEEENGETLSGQGKGREFGQTNAQQHRSAVANFVQGLVHVADREPGGIGEQVREIAREQNQSASTTVQAMEQVQNRNEIRTFLFGSDYRNLGALRSEMVKTRNRLEQLNRTMENMENEEGIGELQTQIQEMEQEQERIENFIKEKEGEFSLFGWLFKWFYGYENLEE